MIIGNENNCNFCNGREEGLIDIDNEDSTLVWIDGIDGFLNTSTDVEYKTIFGMFKINYCPICGRRL